MNVLYGSKRSTPPTLNAATSGLQPGDLGDGHDHELRGLQRREPDDDIHPAQVDLRLRVDGLVAGDEETVGLGAGPALLERPSGEQPAHERDDGQAELR